MSSSDSQMNHFGELLVQGGCISQEALETALALQAANGAALDEIFISSGALTESQLADCVCARLGLRRLQAGEARAQAELRQALPLEVAQRLRIAPLRREGLVLVVACCAPDCLGLFDEAQGIGGMDVEAVVCTRREFREIFSQVYGEDAVMKDMLNDFDSKQEALQDQGAKAADEDYHVSTAQGMAADAKAVKLLKSLLHNAVKAGASDVHVRALPHGVLLHMRIQGALKRFEPFARDLLAPLVLRVKVLSGLDTSRRSAPQSGRFHFRAQNKDISVQASIMPTMHGEKLVLRLQEKRKQRLSLKELGLGERERQLLSRAATGASGMILSTGPVGSVNSELLYSLLELAREPGVSMVTLEDTVASRLDHATQIQLDSLGGMSFASALRFVQSQDPDVIMAGELRDREAASTAMEAVMNGCRVFSTLHAYNAPSALGCLLEMGLDPFLVANTVRMVVTQRRARRVCSQCIAPHQASRDELFALGMEPKPDMLVHLFRGAGCPQCGNTGYSGEVSVFEVLQLDDRVKELVARGAAAHEIRDTAMTSGSLRSLKDDAVDKVFEGVLTFEEYSKLAL